MKILAIDDEEILVKAIKKTLEKEGYTVDYLTDPEAAKRRLELSHQDYDLVIMDWIMPGLEGVDLAKHLRQLGISIPILMLTAKVGIDDKVKALDIGADDYLVKPFSSEELAARVRALLRRPVEALPGELVVDDIAMNLVTREVLRGKQKIDLTVKEFSLLEYFMRHPNQVVSRLQILDHLWGFDFDSFSNVVDVHVKNLRRKLNKGRKKNILETVRGIGYKLRQESVGNNY